MIIVITILAYFAFLMAFSRLTARRSDNDTFFRGNRVKIHRAEVSDGESKEAPGTIISTKDGLTIACGKGALTISSLQPENHKRMAAGDFVNGYQVKVNDTFDC